jgi:oligoribonuclease
MHEKSGLLADCAVAKNTVRDLEDSLLLCVPEYQDLDDRWVIAGSTISFDLAFLRVHMPRLAARLHYRLYDVSGIKLFCQSLGMSRIPKGQAHRARADILESVSHLKECVDWMRGEGFGLPAEIRLACP